MLERFSLHFDQPGNINTTVQFLALYVIALYYNGKPKQARAAAARLLALSEAEGNIRVYLEKGELMRRVLQSLVDTQHDQENGLPPASIAFARKLLARFEQDAQRPVPSAPNPTPPALRSPLERSDAPVEPLTRREREVLRLLLAGASNQEIAR